MIRWLLIGLVIYMIYRLITGPNKKRRQNPFFNVRFGQFSNDSENRSEKQQGGQNRSYLDQIEDAEFEDITEEDITQKKSDT
jgi:hypothetical protein